MFEVVVLTFTNGSLFILFFCSFLSPYLQNATCDSPGDPVPCSEHHVWGFESHSRSSPSRAFISGNPGWVETWKWDEGRELLQEPDEGWLFCFTADYTSHKNFCLSRSRTVLIAYLLEQVFCCIFQHVAFYFISGDTKIWRNAVIFLGLLDILLFFLYFVLDASM